MNFIVSFLYMFAAYGLIAHKGWTPTVLILTVVLMLVAAVGFYLYVQDGGAYEQRTIGALTFRIFVTVLLYVAARYYIRRSNPRN